MVANADGTASSSLGVRDAFEPDWSPDGTMIAFTRPNGPASSEIWVVNADGTILAATSGTRGSTRPAALDPRWHQSRVHLALGRQQRRPDDRQRRWHQRAPAREPEAYEYSGSIQGGQLVYVVDGQVHVAGVDGSDPHAVTAGPNDGDRH